MANTVAPPNRSSSRRSVARAAGEIHITSTSTLYLNGKPEEDDDKELVVYANADVFNKTEETEKTTIESLLLTSWSKVDVSLETQTLVTYLTGMQCLIHRKTSSIYNIDVVQVN